MQLSIRLVLIGAAAAVLSVRTDAFAQGPVAGPPVVYETSDVFETSNGLPIGVSEATGGMYGEPMQRFDSQYPWMHGYLQEIPPYAGYGAFRPYNYKHVFSQAQTAGGWGMSPTMPYAQQFWHRYRKRALMMPEPTYSR